MDIITQKHGIIYNVRIRDVSKKVLPATVLLVEKGVGTEKGTIIGEVGTVEVAEKALSSIHKAFEEDRSPWDFNEFMEALKKKEEQE